MNGLKITYCASKSEQQSMDVNMSSDELEQFEDKVNTFYAGFIDRIHQDGGCLNAYYNDGLTGIARYKFVNISKELQEEIQLFEDSW